MDQDKRRSKDEEEELDRKIALIREKNQKIEQRSKEIEADRAGSIEHKPEKSLKPSSVSADVSQPTSRNSSKKSEWSREWDHGKTPAASWRENVPSMEMTHRLAGSKNTANNGANTRLTLRQESKGKPSNGPKIAKGGRLEGRITVSAEDNGVSKSDIKERKIGMKIQLQITTSNVQESNGQPVVGNKERRKAGRHNNNNNSRSNNDCVNNNQKEGEKNDSSSKENSTNNEVQSNKRNNRQKPPRENDRYAVKSVMLAVINKVVRKEKQDQRRERLCTEEADKIDKDSQELQKPVSSLPESEKESSADTQQESSSEEKELVSQTEVEADNNQNVIKLVEEKVLSLQMA